MLRAVLALALALATSAELITFHSQVRADKRALGLSGDALCMAALGWPALHNLLICAAELAVSHACWLSNLAWRLKT